ncbi:purine-nucleoside phosphorylase [Marinicrinis sediminis]|uniref:Purine nucleoside phosphorylase n=1 Tax=Marinicrinis sediminis TaxID=1652465 RepID=A0ABW5RDR4_9BACL
MQTAETYRQHIQEAAAFVKEKLNDLQPSIGLILGSGLGDLGNEVEQSTIIPYAEIPHFPASTVAGHAGQFVIGTLEGQTVIVMQGRFHYYEGYTMQQVVLPVYVMKQLGVEQLVITNAAGGMNPSFQPGNLMLITDHLNMTGDHPLIGPNHPELGQRFPDMSAAYCPKAVELASQISDEIEGLTVQQGLYAGITGPAYLTPAELTMLAKLGGDAVGMSTVPEVIAASHADLRVLGISCITDMAIGEELEPLTHEQVVAVANETKPKFMKLVRAYLARSTERT